MKRAFCLTALIALLAGCKPDEPPAPSDTIDPAIVGAWQVAHSRTITGVRMLPDGNLEPTDNVHDTLTFDGTPGTVIASYLFGTQENVIDLRSDNRIKVYRINSRGGVTITGEQVPYEVYNDTLYTLTSTLRHAHRYRLQGDSLVIERIPDGNTGWTYICSKYFRREL